MASQRVIDGALDDWLESDRIDDGSTPGYEISATTDADEFIFAIEAAQAIGPNTTIWLNTDRNASTGYQVFGFAGGAEYNVNFSADGTVNLYSGGAGETLLVSNLTAAWSTDRTIVEFAVPKVAVGTPNAIDTLYDINDSVFLPSSYSAEPFTVFNDTGITPATDTRIGIVYSETTANAYFSKMAYSQLFMSVQSQAMQAGLSFDILTEADLTDLAKLAQYDALIFPSFRNVPASQADAIAHTLEQASVQFGLGLITAGEFMTNDADGSPLPGNPYSRMALLFDAARVTGGTADVTVTATDTAGLVLDGYALGETVLSYSGVGWNAFESVSHTGQTVATETVNGTDYAAVLATQTGGRNVLFSTEGVMADANMLQKAIDYVVNGSGISVGLQMTRDAGIVAARVDMDQSQEQYEVNPEDGSPGIYDILLPILTEWKNAYNFVASYYLNVGNRPNNGQQTDWSVSLPYYKAILDLGNELGNHSYTHPDDTNILSPSQIQFEFGQSTAVLEQQLSAYLGWQFDILGASLPGAPETLATALSILPYAETYITGGYAAQGSGYPNAFGYLTPDSGKVYFAPNTVFDFTLFEFQNKTPEEAAAAWAAEWNALTAKAEAPVILWPFHDYGAAMWNTDGPSPYLTQVYTDWIARAASADMEFVTLADLADRINAFEAATVTSTISGNTITATVAARYIGTFALDVDGQGSSVIQNVAGWYAYDNDSVFMPANGGTFTITLGAVQDDVTHITDLPMRAYLISVSGDGENLTFTLVGEGLVVIDIADPGTDGINVTGATIVSRVGELLTLDVGPYGYHGVSLSFEARPLPVITSNGGGDVGGVTIAENGSAVTTVVANNATSYSILSGGDGLLFDIDPTTGVLTFKSAPDYEAPSDSDGNNVYQVTVAANGDGGTDTQQLTVTVSNVVGITQSAGGQGGTVNGTNEEDTLSGAKAADTLNGFGGNDSLKGNAGADTLNGGPGADSLDGGDGRDTLNGGDGADILLGGVGTDTLTGGTGSDVFDYNAITHSTVSSTARDVIMDFEVGVDKIDLSGIDANTGRGGNQAFTFLPTAGAAFTAAGQVSYHYEFVGGVEYTVIDANVNANLGSDFQVALLGHHVLSASDIFP